MSEHDRKLALADSKAESCNHQKLRKKYLGFRRRRINEAILKTIKCRVDVPSDIYKREINLLYAFRYRKAPKF